MVDKGVLIRAVLYSVAILYVGIDLVAIKGPLHRAMTRLMPRSAEVMEAAKEQGVVAQIYYQPIVLGQVERRVEENLWREGRTVGELKPEERLQQRRAALNELIDLHLLRLKVRFNRAEAPVEDSEIDAELATFTKRFASETEFKVSLAQLGWSEKELRFRVAARIQQEKYLEHMIEITVSEKEARDWFEEKKDRLAQPARVRARHIFRSTLNAKPDAVVRELEEARGKLEAKESDFASLARTLSEDERTSQDGGELGWMQAGRLPKDFGESLFGLEVGKPAIVQSKIGCHLVEVLDQQPRVERSFEEARGDVMSALEGIKRSEGLKIYRQNLRYRDEHKIEVFLDVLERGLDLPAKE